MFKMGLKTEITIINDKQPANEQTSGKSFLFSRFLAIDKMETDSERVGKDGRAADWQEGWLRGRLLELRLNHLAMQSNECRLLLKQ